jgi:hypothetical protein
MAARLEGRRQRLGENSLLIADDKSHLQFPPASPVTKKQA